jgi:AbiTii-like protein
MSLLEEIQASAVDGNNDLGTVLRKCKLLASRLGSQPLESWLVWESNGYPDGVEVPDYRIWPLQLKGHFAGYFGSGLQGVQIPLAVIPERVRGSYERYECRQSVAGIEATLAAVRSGKGTVTVPTGDLALALGGDVYENYNCLQAWAEFSTGHLFELLNSVRNRILDFALALWKESPAAGEVGTDSSRKLEAAQVTQIFQTTVYGGSATLVGSAPHSSINLDITSNDFGSLQQSLLQQGLSAGDTKELEAALAKDPKPTAKGKLGPTVSAWMGKMVKKAAEGTWNAGVDIAGKILSEAITKYYGLQ